MVKQDGTRDRGGLIVVSNRLPYNIPRRSDSRRPKRNVGGLVSAMEPVLEKSGGSWIGWDGVSLPSAGAVASVVASPRTFRTHNGIDLYGVPLSEREVGRYYHGFSNRALWPLFHDLLSIAVFYPEDYSAYVRVNRRFAETTLARAGKNDRIWVHDYHLMLVPVFLREMGFRGRIDFFLHIPFPAPEIFRALPSRDTLMRGLLAADTAVFHTRSYRENFVGAAESIVGARLTRIQEDECVLEHSEGCTVAGVGPIGVDVNEFERIADSKETAAKVEKLRAYHAGRAVMFSADRLDYTKGIVERLHAVERMLVRRPSLAGKFELVQIVVPSRHQVEEYRELKRLIDEEAGRINSQYGLEEWAPIRYRYRALDREDLIAHYRLATVALVTPLKDGMNLVAPEFVVSRTDGDGVLVLSEFAGVAEHLDGAVLVNPYDVDRCAEAIVSALTMSVEERRRRMADLRRQVRANPVSVWADRCLNLSQVKEAVFAVHAEPDSETDASRHWRRRLM
jgi:trehalose 6-phosphate synthase